jgi:hypothetical protein
MLTKIILGAQANEVRLMHHVNRPHSMSEMEDGRPSENAFHKHPGQLALFLLVQPLHRSSAPGHGGRAASLRKARGSARDNGETDQRPLAKKGERLPDCHVSQLDGTFADAVMPTDPLFALQNMAVRRQPLRSWSHIKANCWPGKYLSTVSTYHE